MSLATQPLLSADEISRALLQRDQPALNFRQRCSEAIQVMAHRLAVLERAVGAAAKPSTCCPGEHLVPMHSTDTKLCTGCKTEKHWPLEPGQKRTY